MIITIKCKYHLGFAWEVESELDHCDPWVCPPDITDCGCAGAPSGFPTHFIQKVHWILKRATLLCAGTRFNILSEGRSAFFSHCNVTYVYETGEWHINTRRRFQSSALVAFEYSIFYSTGRHFADCAISLPMMAKRQLTIAVHLLHW